MSNSSTSTIRLFFLSILKSTAVRTVFLALIGCASLLLFTIPGRTSDSPLIISELRLRGPNGDEDEFIEIYNNNNFPHVVNSSDGSSGYALVASDGVIRFIIPNGTVIPGRGNFLVVNSDGYSLASHPAGVGTTATGDASFTNDIPDNAGIALFSSANSANFTIGFRMDAVGSTNVSNTLFKEGAGYTPLIPFNIEYSYFRRVITSGDAAGQPQDIDNNAADFLFADPDGNSIGAGQRLGAPGPQNLSAPPGILFPVDNHTRLDPAQADNVSPNVSRTFVSDPINNATFGTVTIRRTFTNTSGLDISRLRFRVADLTTFPAPFGIADLRPSTSGATIVTLTDSSTVPVQGTTLEQPPVQFNGGGFNSAMSVDTVTELTPLPNGASINLQFLMGIQQPGCYAFKVVAESLPLGLNSVFVITGDTEGGTGACAAPTPTPTPTPSPTPTPEPGGTSLIISEFRVRGLNGAEDEFVEIYNNSDVGVNVNANDGSAGYAVSASDGITRFVIPNGTIIPARGHFLGVNVLLYGLGGYPAGNGTNATGDAFFTVDIPDNAGIAIFRTADPNNFTLANQLDAVGSTTEGNALYKEGTGYPALTPLNLEYSFYRKIPAIAGGAGTPQDSNNNAADFLFVDPDVPSTNAGAGQRLGAPGPETLSGPRTKGSDISHARLDVAQAESDFPNVFRSFVSDAFNNSPLGTLSIRRTFTNNTGTSIDRLRFRIVDLTTFPAVSGVADLRMRTSSTTLATLTGGAAQTVHGTTLEPGRPVQVFGGGFNSSVSVNTITPETPLANGAGISLQFLLGVQQTGCYRFAVVAESLPEGGSSVFLITGDTEGGAGACADPPLLTSSLAVTSLARSKSDLSNVGLAANGNGSTLSVAVFGDEDDETPTSPNKVNSPDAKDIAPGTLRLRAERTNAGDGRVYLIVVTATNVFGSSSRNCHTVVVPKKKAGDTDAQAAAAKAFCEANGGAPPPGYFVIGDGPIIGPKQ